MHNDVSFLLSGEMSLYEQQSTYNPNMPLRMLQYVGSLYEKHLALRHLNKYGRALLRLPAARLVVFYNGIDPIPDETTLRLSDSFPEGASSDIEVRVRMVNVNRGHSRDLMERCRPLYEYAWTVGAIRDKMASKDKGDLLVAIDKTLDEMPRDFVIRPFLLAHRAEVRDMLLTEYNEAETMELFREEGREEGRLDNLRENLLNLVNDGGFTLQRALDVLKVSAADRELLIGELQNAQ